MADTVREVSASPMSRIFFFDDPASDRYFWKMFAAGIVLLVSMTGLDQDLMQRNMSCATPRDSQKNIILTAFSQMFVIFLFLVLGVLLFTSIWTMPVWPCPKKTDQVFSLCGGRGRPSGHCRRAVCHRTDFEHLFGSRSALTALTTSFTVDILEGPKRMDDARLTRLRKGVHIVMRPGDGGRDPGLRILGRRQRHQPGLTRWPATTYGPILGMFAFGMVTRRRVRDRWIPAGGAPGPSVERPAAVVGPRGVGLPNRFRTADLQCRLYDDRHVVTVTKE